MLKAYDPKKSVWAPDGQGGFKEGLLENDDGTKATVMIGHEVTKTMKLGRHYELHILYLKSKINN